MAKKSKIAAELRRREVVARYAERRAELKRASVNPHLSQAERDEAMAALHALPRDASPTRLRRRDAIDGRPRGHLRVTGTSRVRFRQMALRGASSSTPGSRAGSATEPAIARRRSPPQPPTLTAPTNTDHPNHPYPRSSHAPGDPPQLPAHRLSR